MENDTLVVEESYPFAGARVWQAITDKEQMKKWYFDLSAFIPEPDSNFNFQAKGKMAKLIFTSAGSAR